MTDCLATTPFGARPLSAAVFQITENNRTTQKRLADPTRHGTGNRAGRADKWQLLRALTVAKQRIGVSDRAIAVLEALCSFQKGAELDGTVELIVFPSNAELCNRLRGMAQSTLRRHLAALVDAGLILRRDSANGKRYCRRDPSTGEIHMAFGFDLSPFVLAAPEIYDLADEVTKERFAREKTRTSITIHLRDCRKIIDSAITEALDGPWQDHSAALDALSGRVSRHGPTDALQLRLEALAALRVIVERDYLNGLDLRDNTQKKSGNAAKSGRHIHNSNTESISVNSPEKEKKDLAPHRTETGAVDGDEPVEPLKNAGDEFLTEAELPPLSMVLAAVPDLSDYARDGISSWSDFDRTVALIRTMLGVSPSAWAYAQQTMGPRCAAIMLACILARADEIKSPGGYVRALADRAAKGKFSIWPMVRALVSDQ
ncbi:MAG: plasmid replication protein RepC [Ahrensia sp.]